MSEWKNLAHFLYGKGFWYADPLWDVVGLTEEQLFWVPDKNSLPIIWQVGHIAHRERYHIGRFVQGEKGRLIPEQYEVFGTGWCPVERILEYAKPVNNVLEWAKEVRALSHAFIDGLKPEDFHRIPETSGDNLSIAHWLFITACHTALHIGRIQSLRAIMEGKKERAC